MNRLLKLLLALSVGLLVAGIGLAVAQPGSLGDGDGDETASAVPDDTSGDTSDDTPDDTSGVTPDDGDTGDDDPTVETSTPPTTGDGAGPTDTTAPSAAPSTTEAPVDSGSGLGSDGSGEEDTSDDLADTGGPSLVVLGLALGLVGLTLRQRSS